MNMPRPKRPDGLEISVVVPLLNEEENVAQLVERVRNVLDQERPVVVAEDGVGDASPSIPRWELILVDDGSSDATAMLAREANRKDARVRLVELARRYGQSTAMQAGFDHALGSVVVTLDGDLQNDPADIPRVVEALERGYDLAVGYRERRQDPFLTRRLPSSVANRLIGLVTGVRIRDNGCSLKAYRRELLDRVRLYSDLHRFIPALAVRLAGARVVELPVRHHARARGTSKYGLSRTGSVFVDLLTVKAMKSLREQPLRLFGGLSLSLGIVGTAGLVLSLSFLDVRSEGVFSSLVLPGAFLLMLALAGFLLMGALVIQVAAAAAVRPDSTGPIAREVWQVSST